MAKEGTCGICCIESVWSTDDGEVAATPVLRTLAHHHRVPFETNPRPFSSGDEFFGWLERWTRLGNEVSVLYVSSHGFAGGISAADADPVRDNVRLAQMADLLEELGAGNSGCLVHFGSCSTQRETEGVLRDFRDRSGFDAVSGYRRDIDWIKPLAFDLLYLDHLLSNAPRDAYLSAQFMEDVHGELRERSWYGLGHALGFHIDTGL